MLVGNDKPSESVTLDKELTKVDEPIKLLTSAGTEVSQTGEISSFYQLVMIQDSPFFYY